MTKLLVSIRDAAEARIACRCPIGILDVKEPNHGALGAADPETINEIASSIGPEVTKSFSAGELCEWEGLTNDAERIMPDAQCSPLLGKYGRVIEDYRFIKIGLAKMATQPNWKRQWRALFRGLPAQTSPVAVAYFDHHACGAPSPVDIIELAREQATCSTILFDTYRKHGDLFSNITQRELKELITQSGAQGLTTVVAGSVSLKSLSEIVAVEPDCVGVRGAVCTDGRASQISERLISELLNNLQAATAH